MMLGERGGLRRLDLCLRRRGRGLGEMGMIGSGGLKGIFGSGFDGRIRGFGFGFLVLEVGVGRMLGCMVVPSGVGSSLVRNLNWILC